jgi:hypothetical protein
MTRIVALLVLFAFALCGNQAAADVPKMIFGSDLAISLDGKPGYEFTGKCGAKDSYLIVHVRVQSNGSAPSPSISDGAAVTIIDQNNAAWNAGSQLVGLAPGTGVAITLALPVISPASAMTGNHTFTVSVNKKFFTDATMGDNSFTLSVGGGKNCGGRSYLISSGALPSSNRNVGVAPALNQGNPIASPTRLYYTNDPKVCVDHTGLAGAFICPGMLADGTILALIWNWDASTCYATIRCVTSIDGFHIYRVTGGASSRRYAVLATHVLIDTQSDPALTLRGIKPWSRNDCFAVTAFKGKNESDDSDWFCVSGAQVALGTENITLYPSRSQTRKAFNVACAHPNIYDAAYTIDTFELVSGTMGFTSSNCQGNENSQGLFAFDFAGRRTAQKATLILQINGSGNCATQVAETQFYWPAENPANPMSKKFEATSPTWRWDLTPPVNGEIDINVLVPYNSRWLPGGRMGFALIGPGPPWGGFQSTCLTGYIPRIEVTQYK